MKEKIAILKSRILHDFEKINNIFTRTEKAYNDFRVSKEYSKLIESAFYASQLYSGFENIFKAIAKTFENNIEKDYWHKSLLIRMNMEIQDIRPALLSNETFICLDEIRAFRNYFRNAYDIDIDGEKFGIVADKVFKLKALSGKDISGFIQFLDSLLG